MKVLFMLLGSYLILLKFFITVYTDNLFVYLVVLLIVESLEVCCREECCY